MLICFHTLFYQAANRAKYIKKSNFNRLPEILALEPLKSDARRPHRYAAPTRASAERAADRQEEISRNLEPSQKLRGLQKATGANDIDVFSIPYGTPATENVPIPSINFSLPRNISGRGMNLFFQY